MSKEALEKLIALFLVTFRPRFQERLTNLCHATTFLGSDSFQVPLQVRGNPKGKLRVLFHPGQILPSFFTNFLRDKKLDKTTVKCNALQCIALQETYHEKSLWCVALKSQVSSISLGRTLPLGDERAQNFDNQILFIGGLGRPPVLGGPLVRNACWPAAHSPTPPLHWN
ncbi:MAG: hypothetical protein WAR24_07160 [Candidatus Acidiferrales bacterium]